MWAPMTMASGCALALAATVAGCGVEDLAERESPIIGGTRSIGTEATVLLASFPADRSVLATCTAVLVSPTVLLTAAHCVDDENHPGYLYGVFTGDDASPYSSLALLEPHLADVVSVHAHPQYSPDLPFYADIATVVLAAPLDITPAPFRATPLDASFEGMTARIVGYGQTTYGQYNSTRYEASTQVVTLDNDTIVVGDAGKHSCLGDSGGPAFVNGTVVGIDSYGPVGCDAPSHYRRTDTFLPFIRQYVPEETVDPTPDPDDPGTSTNDDGGGCSTKTGASIWVALALLFVRRSRR